MGNVSFTIEEENLICIYHKHDRRRTIAAISDALPDMDGDMRPLAALLVTNVPVRQLTCRADGDAVRTLEEELRRS